MADVLEDTKSNELTWLLGKIANFLTSGDAIVPEDYALPPGQRPYFGLTQELLLECWSMLRAELQEWHASRPRTFAPSARTKASIQLGSGFEDFEQIWYDVPLCAAAMQGYHQACILLLVNRPQESTAIRSTVSARLESYRQIHADVSRHAREICGISLANPTDAFRVNSTHSLFVAGQAFHEPQDQKVVHDLLLTIEKDFGWTTKYHRAKLKHEWDEGQRGVDWALP